MQVVRPLLFSIAALTVGSVCGQVGDQRLALPNALSVEDLGKGYRLDPAVTPDYLYFAISDGGGTTSIRARDSLTLRWKDEGYFQRNRELGQTFSIPADTAFVLDALVVRTGNSSSAVLEGAPGAPVQLQLFEVTGEPTINDNGTPRGTESEHGFSTNHRTDDYLEGLTYTSLFVARGGTFPAVGPTDQNGGQPGHLRYLRFDLEGEAEIVLEGGKRYAWLLGFDGPGAARGFSLGNNNTAASGAAPALRTDARGEAWWSLRREGDGTLPPSRVPGEEPPANPDTVAALRSESLFQPGYEWNLPPTTDGWPDVDTYRTMEFYLETSPVDTMAVDTMAVDTTGQDTIASDTTTRVGTLRLPNPILTPNPTTGSFTIGVPAAMHDSATPMELSVFDAAGRVVLRRTVARPRQRLDVDFAVPPPPGTYTVTLRSGRGAASSPLQIAP